jgi:hypothetical protein
MDFGLFRTKDELKRDLEGAYRLSEKMKAVVDYDLQKVAEFAKEATDPNTWKNWPDPNDPQVRENMRKQAFDLALNWNPAAMAITAYHGSPHKFDKFRLDKIGTGEGAQAYGHGLYFAENPNVAGSYIHSNPSVIPNVKITPEVKKALGEMDFLGYDSPAQALNHLRSTPNWMSEVDLRGVSKESIETISKHITENPRGFLYKTDIPDEAVGKMLDWDKPLSQQPESVRKALSPEALGLEIRKSGDFYAYHFPNGGGFASAAMKTPESAHAEYMKAPAGVVYHNMGAWLGGEDAVSKKLLEQGIPGIKYLDQGSRQFYDDAVRALENSKKKVEKLRTSGITDYHLTDAIQELQSSERGVKDLTYNFVVFDENLPKILERK